MNIRFKVVFVTTLVLGFVFAMSNVCFSFNDVNENTSYSDSINWLSENKVIQGYGDGSFRPDKCVSRAEFLKLLFYTNELSEGEYKKGMEVGHYYTDVSRDKWYADYVDFYTSREVIQGYGDGSFKPDKCLNKAEAVKMAIEDFGFLNTDFEMKENYADVKRSAWYFKYIHSAIDRNLLGKLHVTEYIDKKYFHPDEEMSRKEISELLFRMKALKDNFVDLYNDELLANNILPEFLEKNLASYKVIKKLQHPYSKDENHVYKFSEIITWADPETFEVLGDFESLGWIYEKDYKDVYYNDIKIEDAKSMSFIALGLGYSKDESRVYFEGGVIVNADSASFIDLVDSYAKDKNSIYYNGQILSKVDVSSFEVLSYPYAKDKNNVYYLGKLFPEVDVASFEIIEYPHSKDKNHVYKYNLIVE